MRCCTRSAAHEIVAWSFCWAQKWDHLWKQRVCFDDKESLRTNFWVFSFDQKNDKSDFSAFFITVTHIFLIQKLSSLWRDKLSLTFRAINATMGVKTKLVLLSWPFSAPGQMLLRQNSIFRYLGYVTPLSPVCTCIFLLCVGACAWLCNAVNDV